MSDARLRALRELDAANQLAKSRRRNVERPLDADFATEWELIKEGHGRAPAGDSPGGRFVASATYQSWVAGRDEVLPPITVAEDHELVDTAALVDFPAHTRARTDLGGVRPQHTPLELVEVVPVETQLVHPERVDDSTEVDGWGVPPGAPSPELTGVDGDSPGDVEMVRWAGHVNIPRYLMEDDRIASRLVDRVLTRAWFRSLAFEVLAGDGSETGTRIQLDGIGNRAGVGSVAVAGGDTTTAVLAAVAVVEDGGYPGPHILVANPVDKAAILGDSAWHANRAPTLQAVIGFDKIPTGTAYLGQAGAAVLYSQGGLTIEATDSHDANFLASIATVQPAGFVNLDVPYPEAFALITAL